MPHPRDWLTYDERDRFPDYYYDVDQLGRRVVNGQARWQERPADRDGAPFMAGDFVAGPNGWRGRVVRVDGYKVFVDCREREERGWGRDKPVKYGGWRVLARTGQQSPEDEAAGAAPRPGPLARLDADVAAVCALVAA